MAGQSDLRAKLEQEVTCAICLDQLKDPKLLPCHHSFCKTCLERHQRSREQQRDILLCPVCKKVIPLSSSGIDALPIDFKYKNLVDLIQSTKVSDLTPPTREDAPNQPPLRPFLDYAARSRARPLYVIKSYGKNNEGFGRLYGLAFGSNGAILSCR